MTLASFLDYHLGQGRYERYFAAVIVFVRKKSGSFVMDEDNEDTPFTDHLLDQFGAYYTITLVALQLLMQWRLHHRHAKIQDAISPKS